MEFLIDFNTNVSEYIEKNFGEYKWKDGSIHHKKTHFNYYTLQEKYIPIKPRNIIVSDVFNCPGELKESWSNLKSIIRTGGDINPYRSNLATKQTPDQLLYEWNIFHLHFIAGKRSRDEVPDNLLFCTFDEQTCYAIQICGHESFHKDILFATLIRNWSHLVTEIPGLSGTELTESARATLRKKNGNCLTSINGKAYAPKKLPGITGAGHPINAYMHSVYDLRVLEIIKAENHNIENSTIQFLKNYFLNITPSPLLAVVNLNIVLEEGKMRFYLDITTHTQRHKDSVRLPYQIAYSNTILG